MTRTQVNLIMAIDANLKRLEMLLPKSKIAKETTKLLNALAETLNQK
jgi:hypothetical protein